MQLVHMYGPDGESNMFFHTLFANKLPVIDN